MECVCIPAWRFQKHEVDIWNCHVPNLHLWCSSFPLILGSLTPSVVYGLCACRRCIFFLKQHVPGCLEHVCCGCCRVFVILRYPVSFLIWSIYSEDYTSKTASKFCAKRCAALPHMFLFQLDVLGNLWDDRNLDVNLKTKMSTRMDTGNLLSGLGESAGCVRGTSWGGNSPLPFKKLSKNPYKRA